MLFAAARQQSRITLLKAHLHCAALRKHGKQEVRRDVAANEDTSIAEQPSLSSAMSVNTVSGPQLRHSAHSCSFLHNHLLLHTQSHKALMITICWALAFSLKRPAFYLESITLYKCVNQQTNHASTHSDNLLNIRQIWVLLFSKTINHIPEELLQATCELW